VPARRGHRAGLSQRSGGSAGPGQRLLDAATAEVTAWQWPAPAGSLAGPQLPDSRRVIAGNCRARNSWLFSPAQSWNARGCVAARGCVSGHVGATVTARPHSGAVYSGDRVRSGRVETQSLTVTDPYGADRAGSPNLDVYRIRRLQGSCRAYRPLLSSGCAIQGVFCGDR